jgi:acetate---CoA ligase (ADP-forming)
MMFGLGGIFVEVLKDVTFRVAPVTDQPGMRMLGEIRGAPIWPACAANRRATSTVLAEPSAPIRP